LSAFLLPFGATGDISPCIRHRPLVPSLYFLDSVVRTSRQARIRLGGEARDRLICGHETALVARTCSPAKLLGFLKFVGTPRCNDARRCHPRGWHNQGAPAAMASGGEASSGALQEGNPLGLLQPTSQQLRLVHTSSHRETSPSRVGLPHVQPAIEWPASLMDRPELFYGLNITTASKSSRYRPRSSVRSMPGSRLQHAA
jgi:hypothetical protein